MIYFYLWVFFLLSIVLALPITVFVEKSRVKKAALAAMSPADEEGEQSVEESPVEAGEAEGEMAEFGEAVPAGADDFSAFDEFK